MAAKTKKTVAKYNSNFLAVAAVTTVLAVIFIVTLLGKSVSRQPVPQTVGDEGYPSIQSDADLETASAELDSTNLDNLDEDLNQLSSDSSF